MFEDFPRRSSSHGKLAGMQGVVSRPDVRKQHPTESLALLSDCGWTSIPLTAHRACHILRVYRDRSSVFEFVDFPRRSSSHGKLAGMQGVVSRPDVRKQHPTESLALLSDSGWTPIPLAPHRACHMVYRDRISV